MLFQVKLFDLRFNFELNLNMSIFSNKIVNGDSVFDYLKKPHQSFDVVFADPPYDLPELVRALKRLDASEVKALMTSGISSTVSNITTISVKLG